MLPLPHNLAWLILLIPARFGHARLAFLIPPDCFVVKQKLFFYAVTHASKFNEVKGGGGTMEFGREKLPPVPPPPPLDETLLVLRSSTD